MNLSLQARSLMVGVCSCVLLMPGFAASKAMASEPPVLLVVNQGDATLTVFDPATGRKLATVTEGVPHMVAHEVATSPDGRLAYLPLYGDAGVGKPGTDGDRMLVVDLATRKVVDTLNFGRGVRPHCVIYEPVSGLLYLTTELADSVTIIDPKTLKIVGSIPTHADQSHMLALSHDGKRGYTANVGTGTVSVLDLQQRRFLTSIPVSSTTQRISISNDDSTVFTADQTKPQIAVIDTTTNAVKRWIPIPDLGYGTALTSDGKWMLVTMPGAGALAVVDLKQLKVTQTIPIGPRPQAVVIHPDGKTAFISCLGGRQVVELDLATWAVKASLDSGDKADGMTWAVSR